jgi:hypothetical protein
LRIEDLRLGEFKAKVLENFEKSPKGNSSAIRYIKKDSSFTVKWHLSRTGKRIRDPKESFKQKGVIFTEPSDNGNFFLGSSDKTVEFVNWLKSLGPGPGDLQEGKKISKIEEWTAALEQDSTSPLELPVSVESKSSQGLLQIYLFMLSKPSNTPEDTGTWEAPGVFLRPVTLADVRENRYAPVDILKSNWKQQALKEFLSKSLRDVKEQLSKKNTDPASPEEEGDVRPSSLPAETPTSAYVMTMSVDEANRGLSNEITEVELSGLTEDLKETSGNDNSRGFWLHAGEVSSKFNLNKQKRKPLVIFVYDATNPHSEEESEDEYPGAFDDADVLIVPPSRLLQSRPPDPVPDYYEACKKQVVANLNEAEGQKGKGRWRRALIVTFEAPRNLERVAGGTAVIRAGARAEREEIQELDQHELAGDGLQGQILDQRRQDPLEDAKLAGKLKDAVLNFKDVLMRSRPALPYLDDGEPGVALLPFYDFAHFMNPDCLRVCLKACHLYSHDPNDVVYRSARTLREVLWEVRRGVAAQA